MSITVALICSHGCISLNTEAYLSAQHGPVRYEWLGTYILRFSLLKGWPWQLWFLTARAVWIPRLYWLFLFDSQGSEARITLGLVSHSFCENATKSVAFQSLSLYCFCFSVESQSLLCKSTDNSWGFICKLRLRKTKVATVSVQWPEAPIESDCESQWWGHLRHNAVVQTSTAPLTVRSEALFQDHPPAFDWRGPFLRLARSCLISDEDVTRQGAFPPRLELCKT